jgi:hypothetical protein
MFSTENKTKVISKQVRDLNVSSTQISPIVQMQRNLGNQAM